MRVRLLSAVVALVSVLGGAGCSSVALWLMPGPAATNPLVWVVAMALMGAFVAYGRYALRPLA